MKWPEFVNIIDKLNEECQREVERNNKLLKSQWKMVMVELFVMINKVNHKKHIKYLKNQLYTEEGRKKYERRYPNGSNDVKLESYELLNDQLMKMFSKGFDWGS